jgi:hypothetical protein
MVLFDYTTFNVSNSFYLTIFQGFGNPSLLTAQSKDLVITQAAVVTALTAH